MNLSGLSVSDPAPITTDSNSSGYIITTPISVREYAETPIPRPLLTPIESEAGAESELSSKIGGDYLTHYSTFMFPVARDSTKSDVQTSDLPAPRSGQTPTSHTPNGSHSQGLQRTPSSRDLGGRASLIR
jgi:hypothetical protein